VVATGAVFLWYIDGTQPPGLFPHTDVLWPTWE